MTSQLISFDQIVVQAPGCIVSDMDGEKVMMSVESGKYYSLGQTGGRVWEMVAAPTAVKEIVEALLFEYDVEPEVCKEQVLAFLQQLAKERLILIETAAQIS